MLSIVRKRLQQRCLFNSTSLDVCTSRLLISHFSSGSGSDDFDSTSSNESPTTAQSRQPKDSEQGRAAREAKFKEGTPSWVRELLESRSRKIPKVQRASLMSPKEVNITDVISETLAQLESKEATLNPPPKKKRKDVWKMSRAQLDEELDQAIDTIMGPNQEARKELQQKVKLLKSVKDQQHIEAMVDGSKGMRLKDVSHEMVEEVLDASKGIFSWQQGSNKKYNKRRTKAGFKDGDFVSHEIIEEVLDASKGIFSRERMSDKQSNKRSTKAGLHDADFHKMMEEVLDASKGIFPQLGESDTKVKRRASMAGSISFKVDSVDDFYSKQTLGIFKTSDFQRESSTLKTWVLLEDRERKVSNYFGPTNWWDQCIKWTEDGKLWHFPINNEQGMDKEAEVSFAAHVFLDEHIENWCPRDGPIRHFMELVMVGLSKNPFITVEEKIENLNWYRDYFEKHRAMLEEINALGSSTDPKPLEEKVSG